ncbi:hypothetical protein [Nocardia higoensis]|uniref:hypothetical protein n=1 Tax=Nocardia higoensis TaxID=228599 RepID=UPI0002DD3A18|nr:hypothetical protein [Nocardia higoensis]
MTDLFKADPSWIAGMGVATENIGSNTGDIASFVDQHCPVAPEGFGGAILDPLTTPFRIAADRTRDRFRNISDVTKNTGDELNRAAWLYHEQDRQSYEALNRATTDLVTGQPVDVDPNRENLGLVADYPAPVALNVAAPNLDPPSAAPPEIADLIAEASGAVGDVNEAIKNVTRMAGNEVNVLEKALTPITANWNELRRIGECYKVAGNAMEQSGNDLEAALGQLGPHWDGKAAISFEDWARRQSEALKWEGPVGRIISDILTEVANEIRNGVRRVCELLRDFVASFVDFRSTKAVFKQLVKKIPGIGTAVEIFNLAKTIWEVVDLATGIVEKITDLRNRVMEFLEFIADPFVTAQGWVEEKLEPFTSRVEDAAAKAAQANDVRKIADVNDTRERPKEAFEVGSGAQPWENG